MLNKNFNKRWLPIILIILSVAINLYFRLQNLFLPDFNKQAKREVGARLKDKLYQDISGKYSTLTEAAKLRLLEAVFREHVKRNKSEVNSLIIKRTKELKDFYQDEASWAYMLEIDGYRWLRRIENFINTGHFGTGRVNNQEYDNLMFAPSGREVEPLKLHYYIGAYFYRLLHFLNAKLSLMQCLNLLPVFLSIIMVIAIFAFCSLLGISCLGSFIASLYIGLLGIVFTRTSYGWFDTDIYNIIFPLAIFSTIACTFKAKSPRRYFYLALGGVLVGVYSALWSIWWLVYYILLSGIFFYELEKIIYDEQNTISVKLKEAFSSILVLIAFSYLSVLFISGPAAIKKSLLEPISYLSLRQGLAIDNFWPTMSFTVGELRSGSIEVITSVMESNFLLYAGIIGFLFLFIPTPQNRPALAGRMEAGRDSAPQGTPEAFSPGGAPFLKKTASGFGARRFLTFSLFLWFLVAFFLSYYFGIRFIVLLIPALCISFSLLWDVLNYSLTRIVERINLSLNAKKIVRLLFLSSIFLIVVLFPIKKRSAQAVTLPFINDSYWNMLLKLREITSPDSIINAWWDDGDFIMSIAKRATVHDASWQCTPVTYWMSRALSAKEEKEAVGILRMLDSGANKAFDELLEVLKDKQKTIQIINKLVLLEKGEGYAFLGKYIPDKTRLEKVVNFMYGTTVPAYLLVNTYTIEVINVIHTVANWDFARLDLWQKSLRLKEVEFLNYAQDEFGYTKEYSAELYQTLKIMDKPDLRNWLLKHYQCPFLREFTQDGAGDDKKTILFNAGLVLDKEDLKAYFRDDRSRRWIIPAQVSLETQKGLVEKINKEGDISYSVFFRQVDNKYKTVLTSSPLEETLLFKLFFTKGRGLRYFKLAHQESKNDFDIYLYKIYWDNQEHKESAR